MKNKTNDIVKYKNDFNDLALTGFSGIDLDMLMLIVSKVRNKGTELLYLSYTELKEAVRMSDQNDDYFTRHLRIMSQKLKKAGGSFADEHGFDEFVLFPSFHATRKEEEHKQYGHLEKGTLVVRVNPDWEYLLNEVNKEFTRFELTEFVKLESKYSKNLYRLLKQYRSTGTYIVDANKFRELMDCPKSYPNKLFMRDCVNVAIQELSRGYFRDLKVTPIRAKRRGSPIESYEFTFRKSKDIPGQYNVTDYNENGKLVEPDRKKTTKNRFNNFQQRTYDEDFLKQLERTQPKE